MGISERAAAMPAVELYLLPSSQQGLDAVLGAAENLALLFSITSDLSRDGGLAHLPVAV